MAAITLKNVSKRFPDGTLAVKDASFTVADGEFFILVGPSGCGKSTLLNMIAGIEEISSGELRVDGRLVNDVDPKDRNMAMVFQSYAIYPHMSVRENLAFPLKLAKLPKGEIAQRVQRAAAMLELSDLLDRKPASLSGGQRQRVAMGRALVRQPAAFLLDEPLSNLDARLRVQMRTEIARLQRDLGTTTVYVTHDQTEALTLGHRVAVMRQGVVQQIGTPHELYAQPCNIFVAGFIGSPSINFLPGALHDGRLVLPWGEFALPFSPQDGEGDVIVGIRPEHFRAASAIERTHEDGLTLEAGVEFEEWLGADLYVHFPSPATGRDLPALPPELARPAAAHRVTVVARIDPAAHAIKNQTVKLVLDARHLHLFDARTGARIARPRHAQSGGEA